MERSEKLSLVAFVALGLVIRPSSDERETDRDVSVLSHQEHCRPSP